MPLRWYPLVGGPLDGDAVLGIDPPAPRLLVLESPAPARLCPIEAPASSDPVRVGVYALCYQGDAPAYRYVPATPLLPAHAGDTTPAL